MMKLGQSNTAEDVKNQLQHAVQNFVYQNALNSWAEFRRDLYFTFRSAVWIIHWLIWFSQSSFFVF
jgi:hypothetical protein